jgi:hypothetical protein
MVDMLSDFQSNGNPINFGLSASLQSEDYMLLNAGWNEIQNTRFSTTSSRNMKSWLTGNQ